MSRQKQTALPKTLRNPMVILAVVPLIRKGADVVEHEAKENGTELMMKPVIMQARAFAKELEENANARIGDQLADLA